MIHITPHTSRESSAPPLRARNGTSRCASSCATLRAAQPCDAVDAANGVCILLRPPTRPTRPMRLAVRTSTGSAGRALATRGVRRLSIIEGVTSRARGASCGSYAVPSRRTEHADRETEQHRESASLREVAHVHRVRGAAERAVRYTHRARAPIERTRIPRASSAAMCGSCANPCSPQPMDRGRSARHELSGRLGEARTAQQRVPSWVCRRYRECTICC